MHMKKNRRKRFAKRAAAGLLALYMVWISPGSVFARTTQEVEAEQEALEAEAQELQAQLEQLREDEDQKQKYAETLQKQIDVLVNQIETSRRDIDELNANIHELDLKLEASADEAADTIEQFKQRVAAIYRAGSVSTLEILLNANSFNDFSMRTEMLENMSRHDQELLDKIKAYMDDTRDEREEREKQKALVADLKKSLETKQKEVDALYQENAEAIASLQAAQGETAGELERVAAEKESLADELKKIQEEEKRRQEEERKKEEERRKAAEAAGQNAGATAPGGQGDVTWAAGGTGGAEGFHPCWPLPGVTYISDEFGGARNHGGMDIAGRFGTPIVAAESGKVLRAWTSDTWGMGWGYHVYLYHNDTFCTLYAHMSSVAVSEGQYVNQGDIIGYEGSTGDSTGPHLHFEVWRNGTRVNPRNYL